MLENTTFMNLFYSTNIEDGLAVLDAVEARHCTQVLRKKVSDAIVVVDGKGGWYEGIIEEIGKKSCVISIQKEEQAYQKRSEYLHIAIAPTKNIDRLQWFLEKATEIGIDEITPILCARSERKVIRIDKLEKVLITAMKQSLKAYMPKLNPLTKYADFVKNTGTSTQKMICHCAYDENIHLKENYTIGNDVLIMIGPEGDFSDKEVELALANGFKSTGLGKNRLRTETAGVVACHTINLINE